MRLLLRLLAIPLVLGLGWSGWWFAGAKAQEAAIESWLAGRAASGWQAEYSGLDVTGFPGSFDRRIEDLVLTDPAQGWSLRAPWLASSSPSFELNRFEVTAPPRFTFAVPGERVEVATAANSFQLGVEAASSMPLDRAALSIAGLELDAADWTARARNLEAWVAERAPGSGPDHSYDLALEAEDVALPEPLIARLDPTGGLKPLFERLVIDGHVALDHALDRDFVEAGELSARTIVLERGAFQWGEMGLDASGRLDADEDGRAEGKLALSLTNWKRMIRMAEQSGAIGGNVAGAIEGALGLASLFGARKGELDVSLTFEGGRIWIGPVAIGEAPRISFPSRQRAEG